MCVIYVSGMSEARSRVGGGEGKVKLEVKVGIRPGGLWTHCGLICGGRLFGRKALWASEGLLTTMGAAVTCQNENAAGDGVSCLLLR